MLNRRSFLKLSGLISAAFSLFPFSLGKNVLAKPKEPIADIVTYFADSSYGKFILHSENPYTARPPEITWWEYLRDYKGSWEKPEEMTKADLDDYGIRRKDLNNICPVQMYEDSWCEYYSSTDEPFYYFLEFKDKEILGDKLYDKINWLAGSPGNDYVAIEFKDKETVLEFQRKIKTFGNPVNIEFVNW